LRYFHVHLCWGEAIWEIFLRRIQLLSWWKCFPFVWNPKVHYRV
jgi:hypothetical protein